MYVCGCVWPYPLNKCPPIVKTCLFWRKYILLHHTVYGSNTMHLVARKYFFEIFQKFWSDRFRISWKSRRNVSKKYFIRDIDYKTPFLSSLFVLCWGGDTWLFSKWTYLSWRWTLLSRLSDEETFRGTCLQDSFVFLKCLVSSSFEELGALLLGFWSVF